MELVVASAFQFSRVFFNEFVDTCSTRIEMAAFSLAFCTSAAKDFLAATVNVRGRRRPLGRKRHQDQFPGGSVKQGIIMEL